MRQKVLFRILLPLLCLLSTPSFACSLARWTTVENASGTLQALEDPQHFQANCGLRLALDGLAYVEDKTLGRLSPAINEYSAQFNLYLDNANFSNDNSIALFAAYDADDSSVISLSISQSEGQFRTRLHATDPRGLRFDTQLNGAAITPGWHTIALTWRTATADDANDGELLLEIDGTPAACNSMISGLDNHLQTLASARLGVLSGNISSASGALDIDTFIARRTGFTTNLDCDSSIARKVLPSNQWQQITLPANPGENNTVREILGDDLPAAEYGSSWALYSYDAQATAYVNPGIDGVMEMGVGYWLIQLTGTEVSIDIDQYQAVPTEFDTVLATTQATTWNMVGFPNSIRSQWNQIRVLSQSGTCQAPTGCSPVTAQTENLLHDQGWTYNGTDYVLLDGAADINPWSGFWSATLSAAQGTSLKLAAQ